MNYGINKVVVIGSGTMGGGIAALVANVGIPVYLLDLAPGELTIDEAKRGLKLESPEVRNRIVAASFERLKNSHPPAFLTPESANLVTIGNLEDNFGWVGDADWIVEAIVEQLQPKRALMARIEKTRKPNSIVSSNTSGLPIADISAECSENFKAHFLGTHFFTPPRYMKLLEVIPTAETRPEIAEFVTRFAERGLDKGVVVCKDTPNFIANRLISISAATTLGYVLAHNYTIEEADAILGPLIGRPKTALFRMYDLVGLDVASAVGQNLYGLIENDETREVLRNPKVAPLYASQIQRGRLGDKTGEGFYKKSQSGARIDKDAILTLDLKTMEYRERREPEIASINEALKIKSLPRRLEFVFAQDDRAGALARHVVYNSLAYAARRVPEITDQIINVDNALRWGYAYEMGPFEMWDALGVRKMVDAMKANEIRVALWVEEMLAAGYETFYQTDQGLLRQYDPARKTYIAELSATEKMPAPNGQARYTLTGLEFMRLLMTGQVPPSGMGQLMNFKLVEVSEGRAVFTIKPDERHYNGLGIVHGGLAATLLDSALGCAINTMMTAGKVFTTLEMKINYVRPLRRETGEVRCEASVIHVGGRVATAEGKIVDASGKLYAHGTATCMLYRG
ncbi:MAG TPA: 3-hydroxyacyl-CoA dehydrogenase NAD-binding domain-containing protein [Pyrinomonadaceae bacterium]